MELEREQGDDVCGGVTSFHPPTLPPSAADTALQKSTLSIITPQPQSKHTHIGGRHIRRAEEHREEEAEAEQELLPSCRTREEDSCSQREEVTSIRRRLNHVRPTERALRIAVRVSSSRSISYHQT